MFWVSIAALVSLGAATQQKVLKNKGINPLDTGFKKLADETLKLWHVPGVAIAVVDGDDVWAEVCHLL